LGVIHNIDTMNDLNELEKRIDGCINILNKARTFFNHCKSFLSKDLTNEEKELINKIQIIKDSLHSTWVITILELCKLIDDSPNQKYNLFKLLRCIRNDWNSLNLSDRITLDEFSEIERNLNSTAISERIKSIKTLRDKYYAHTDINNPHPESELIPSFEKLELLINDLKIVLCDLKSKIIKVDYTFVPVFQSDYLMLKDLLIGKIFNE